MVWLHGGSNRVGSGAEPGYDGASLASRSVIVVTINYRLGVMGFFAHPELTAESPHHSSGNYGLLDQIEALRWVKQNIAQFGGDSENVTLFGESAGSVDATTLMASPLAANLFRRVIAESGSAFGLGPSQDLAKMEKLGAAVGTGLINLQPSDRPRVRPAAKEGLMLHAGAATPYMRPVLGTEAGGQPGSQLAVLRNLPAAQIARIQANLIASGFKGYDPNAPIVDGWVLPQSTASAFAQGKLLQVDLLAGLNAREFSAFRIGAAAAAKKSPQPANKPGATEELKQFADVARPLYGNWTNIAVATYAVRILLHGAPAIDQASNDIGVA
jgi:para-nitrobenzyl esterase